MKLFTLSLLAGLVALAAGQDDSACTSIGGTCVDWRDYICHAGVEQGLCSGDENRRCCLECDATCQAEEDEWSEDDDVCTANGGDCFDNSNFCGNGNAYYPGECGGPNERECCRSPLDGECPAMVTRAEWGARSPTGTTYIGDNLPYYFTHHSEGTDCYTKDDCIDVIQGIQNYHMDSNGWNDIGYSFLVGGDGNVYEGRGWNVQGAHTEGYNSVGYAMCFMGDFMEKVPEAEAVNIAIDWQECAENMGKISTTYEMYGHRQAGSTDCPGDMLYDLIQTWPHWTSGSP